MTARLILSSKSPRRCELLKRIGLDFDVIPSRVEEGGLLPGESPREHVLRLSEAKAFEVGNPYPDYWVIGAATVVSVDGTVLGKPKDREEAMEMLHTVSGEAHTVWSG